MTLEARAEVARSSRSSDLCGGSRKARSCCMWSRLRRVTLRSQPGRCGVCEPPARSIWCATGCIDPTSALSAAVTSYRSISGGSETPLGYLKSGHGTPAMTSGAGASRERRLLTRGERPARRQVRSRAMDLPAVLGTSSQELMRLCRASGEQRMSWGSRTWPEIFRQLGLRWRRPLRPSRQQKAEGVLRCLRGAAQQLAPLPIGLSARFERSSPMGTPFATEGSSG